MDSFNATAHMLTAGLQELPTDDVARVKHFLAEYLGDAQRSVPFGGRAQDFTRLDSWLSENEGPSYALLAAPAGRGKSALLLRWCQRLLARSDLAVVYFPVSIRFRTNLAGVVFPALVALLARLHGENIPNDPHTSEEVWHGLLTEYITRPLPGGRQLVLVLDGVDEAADWEAIWSIQMEYDKEDMLATLLTSSSDNPHTWIRMLELATEKTRATGEIRYLLHTLKAAPVALQQAAQQQLYPVLHDILHTLAQLPRREALTNLVSLEPTLRALGGEEALISTVCAALEIGCWWP